MSKNLQYAQTIGNLASMYKDMVAAAEALAQLGSVEQAVGEATKALEKTRAELVQVAGELAVTKGEVEQNRKRGSDELEAARKEAGNHVADAKMSATGVLDKARATAQNLIDGAKADAEVIVAGAKAEKSELETTIYKLRDALAEVSAQVEVAKAEHYELQATIETTRAKLRDVLGA